MSVVDIGVIFEKIFDFPELCSLATFYRNSLAVVQKLNNRYVINNIKNKCNCSTIR